MAVIYSAAIKTARITASRDAVADGSLEIQDAGGNPLAVFGLSVSGGTIAGDTWTLTFDAATVAAGAGDSTPATQAVIKNSGGVAQITGLTVGVATGVPETEPDITLDAATITAGQNVTLSAATIQHAA